MRKGMSDYVFILMPTLSILYRHWPIKENSILCVHTIGCLFARQQQKRSIFHSYLFHKMKIQFIFFILFFHVAFFTMVAQGNKIILFYSIVTFFGDSIGPPENSDYECSYMYEDGHDLVGPGNVCREVHSFLQYSTRRFGDFHTLYQFPFDSPVYDADNNFYGNWSSIIYEGHLKNNGVYSTRYFSSKAVSGGTATLFSKTKNCGDWVGSWGGGVPENPYISSFIYTGTDQSALISGGDNRGCTSSKFGLACMCITGTRTPSQTPTTKSPTRPPTTKNPSQTPTTGTPTTVSPSGVPTTETPTTMHPTLIPTTENPTQVPTSMYPSATPTQPPTGTPTKHPSHLPTTKNPSKTPTKHPSFNPSRYTTKSPTHGTKSPTEYPSYSPTREKKNDQATNYKSFGKKRHSNRFIWSGVIFVVVVSIIIIYI